MVWVSLVIQPAHSVGSVQNSAMSSEFSPQVLLSSVLGKPGFTVFLISLAVAAVLVSNVTEEKNHVQEMDDSYMLLFLINLNLISLTLVYQTLCKLNMKGVECSASTHIPVSSLLGARGGISGIEVELSVSKVQFLLWLCTWVYLVLTADLANSKENAVVQNPFRKLLSPSEQ